MQELPAAEEIESNRNRNGKNHQSLAIENLKKIKLGKIPDQFSITAQQNFNLKHFLLSQLSWKKKIQ